MDAEGATASTSPLLVKLTGYRILNVVLVAGFVVAKAILTYRGRPRATTLDWVLGGVLGIGLWWVGLYESVGPPIWPWFFHNDYAYQVIENWVPLICQVPYAICSIYLAHRAYTIRGTTAMLVCLGCLLCHYILTYCAWWFLDELLAAWLWNMGKPVFFICMSICTWGVSLLPLVLLYKFVWLPFTGETIF